MAFECDKSGATYDDELMKLRLLSVFALTLTFLTPATASSNYIVGGDRPVTVNLPDNLASPAPLLILLHSASTSGAHQEKYMQLGPIAKKSGLIYIAPDGTTNIEGKRFWNASKSCCNKYSQEVDDVAYINSLIDEIDKKTPVDRKRIYLVGHSNGAFMSFTYACKSNQVAAIVAIAGAMDQSPECSQVTPVSLLNIHGTADKVIKLNGGVMNNHPYTSAATTIKTIAAINQCSNFTIAKKDFEPTIKGAETTVINYACDTHTHLQFWKIKDGSHSPKLPRDFAQQMISFLLKQSK
ncbi:LpqC Poly(3-hydroxybutyrate) depolymerase [Candidatus Nanopelagicaceae bacterium]